MRCIRCNSVNIIELNKADGDSCTLLNKMSNDDFSKDDSLNDLRNDIDFQELNPEYKQYKYLCADCGEGFNDI